METEIEIEIEIERKWKKQDEAGYAALLAARSPQVLQ